MVNLGQNPKKIICSISSTISVIFQSKYHNVDFGSHYKCDNTSIPLIQHMISVVHKIIVF
jgi:hypothetical protein